MKETEINAVAKLWLESRGLEVFQEVEVHSPHWRRVDLVGRSARRIVTVEGKTVFGWEVVHQARRWAAEAHESWCIVPSVSPRCADRVRVCVAEGVGILIVRSDKPIGFDAPIIHTPARLHHPKGVIALWAKRLFEEQKTAAPAGSTSGQSTRLGRTITVLVALVNQKPGITLGDAERELTHTYQTRHSFISTFVGHLARKGTKRDKRLAGLRMEGYGSKATLHPVPEDQF